MDSPHPPPVHSAHTHTSQALQIPSRQIRVKTGSARFNTGAGAALLGAPAGLGLPETGVTPTVRCH